MANESNLTPFQPGQVANPRGRPKGSLDMSTRVKRILKRKIDWDKINIRDGDGLEALKRRYGKSAVADALIYIQVSKALTGDTAAFREIRKAGWGDMIKGELQGEVDVVHIYQPAQLTEATINDVGAQLRERNRQAVEAEVIEDDGMESPTRPTGIRLTSPE